MRSPKSYTAEERRIFGDMPAAPESTIEPTDGLTYGEAVNQAHDGLRVAMNNLRAAISKLPWWIRWVMYLLYPFLRFKEEDDGSSEA